MSTVVLSAASPERSALQQLASVLNAELQAGGETHIQTFELATTKLAYCQGEFDCWVKTPGVCRAHDTEAAIVQAIHDSDRLVLLDIVTFGGHSYTLKRALDRIICLVSPFFEKRAELTHHEARYRLMPGLFKLGWMARLHPAIVETWNELADANAINFLSPRYGAAVVDGDSPSRWPELVRALLSSASVPGATITSRESLRKALMDAALAPLCANPVSPHTAAILIGSAKVKGTSVSENLARTLSAHLSSAGVQTSLHTATEFLHEDRAPAAARQIAAADLFVLVTPLYVDAFPALPTHAMEHIASARNEMDACNRQAQFAAIINCGFPEPEHTRTAFAIARHFAASAHYAWAGGLPLGGGGAIDPRIPLDAQHGPAQHVKSALHSAAQNLARGEHISREAVEQMAASAMPDALYRFMGDLGWRYQAYKNRVPQSALRARPLDSSH